AAVTAASRTRPTRAPRPGRRPCEPVREWRIVFLASGAGRSGEGGGPLWASFRQPRHPGWGAFTCPGYSPGARRRGDDGPADSSPFFSPGGGEGYARLAAAPCSLGPSALASLESWGEFA